MSGAGMSGAAHAQVSNVTKAKVNPTVARHEAPASAAHRPAQPSERTSPFLNDNFQGASTPLSHEIPGAVYTGVAGTYDRQTNGGPLHNFQIDPSNPNNIHAVIMTTIANTAADTVGFGYPSRRVMYIKSTDAGASWSTPVALGNLRGGYPSMVLARRGTNYYPVVAMHQAEIGGSLLVVGLYVQKDDGSFSTSYTVSPEDAPDDGEYIWPQIALSPDQSTVYMVASYSYPTAASGAFPDYQPLRFTTFTLDANGGSTWNGWKSIVLGDFTGRNQGYAGVYVLRVSENGKIGLLYQNNNYSEADQGTYFLESTDQGATWTAPGGSNPTENPSPLFPALTAETESGNRSMVTDGLDFFYQGETPHFAVVMNRKVGPYPEPDSMGTYYPITSELYYYNPNATTLKIINHAFPGSYFDFTEQGYPLYLDGDNRIEVEVYDSAAYFSYPADRTDIYIPEGAFISNPTFLRTSNPNVFGIVYETIATDAFGELPGWEADERIFHWFNSIYFQKTTDGGQTWSGGRPFKSVENTDIRFPMTSYYNNIENVEDAKILFAADSLPGQLRGAGQPGWGWTYWYMQNGTTRTVKRTGTTENLTLDQNFPNPFNPSTSVAFSVKQAAQVRLVVEDMMGREVLVAFEGIATPGQPNRVKIDASNLPSGIYQYVLETENESVARRMVLSK